MTVTCPKCSYARTPADEAPAWQCPSCGVAYAKVAQKKLRQAVSVQPAAASDAQSNTRLKGLAILLLGGFGALVFTVVAASLKAKGYEIYGVGWGIPGAYALSGLIQAVTGVPFTQISEQWDELEGWQRGVLGVIVVCVAIAIFMAGVALFA
jgi:hypothetical protein